MHPGTGAIAVNETVWFLVPRVYVWRRTRTKLGQSSPVCSVQEDGSTGQRPGEPAGQRPREPAGGSNPVWMARESQTPVLAKEQRQDLAWLLLDKMGNNHSFM